MKGYFVIDSNAIIGSNGELLSNFLNLDFNKFNHFFIVFYKIFWNVYRLLWRKRLRKLKKLWINRYEVIISLANKIYKSSKDYIINIQNLFREFVNLLYGYDNDKDIDSLTLKQKFYVFYEKHQNELQTFSEQYQHYGLFSFNYVPSDLFFRT